jgi:serine/threonine protein kinase
VFYNQGSNILLTEGADVKLADFGVSAQITATLGKKKSFFGEDKKSITETPIRTFTALQKPVLPTSKGNPNDKIMYYIGL